MVGVGGRDIIKNLLLCCKLDGFRPPTPALKYCYPFQAVTSYSGPDVSFLVHRIKKTTEALLWSQSKLISFTIKLSPLYLDHVFRALLGRPLIVLTQASESLRV